jgi:hypothetical protein
MKKLLAGATVAAMLATPWLIAKAGPAPPPAPPPPGMSEALVAETQQVANMHALASSYRQRMQEDEDTIAQLRADVELLQAQLNALRPAAPQQPSSRPGK